LRGDPRRNRGRSPDRHCAERTRRRAGDPDHDRSGLFYSRRHRRKSLHSPMRVAGPNSRGRHAGRRRTMRRLFISGLSVLAAWLAAGGDLAWSQTFNSGSTGSDLAFSPNGSTTVTVPASGVFNYTTIPGGGTVTYLRNTANTPLTILASGNVTIAGTIDVSGINGGGGAITGTILTPNGGRGGPGGFDGGNGANGVISNNGGMGLGPGGGGGGVGAGSGAGGRLGHPGVR